MNVRRVSLGALCTLQRSPIEIDPVTVYRKAGVRSFGKGMFDYEPAPGFDVGKLRFYELEPDRLVVSNIKAWEGAVAVTSPDESGRIVSNRFLTYRSGSASLHYLLHWLLSQEGNRALQQASPGSADRNRTLSIKNFEKILVPLPPREEQDRIAAYLDAVAGAVDRGSGADKRAASVLEGLREHAFSTLRSGGVAPLSEALSQVEQLETVEPQKSYPTLGVRSFGRGAFDSGVLSGSETSYRSLRRFDAGQVCYPKLMAWQGAFAVVPPVLNGRFASPEFVGFDVKAHRGTSGYISHCLAWSGFTEQAKERSSGTNANRRRLQPRDFLQIEVPLPDVATQEVVARRLDVAAKAVMVARRSDDLSAALLPAARNEIFNSLL